MERGLWPASTPTLQITLQRHKCRAPKQRPPPFSACILRRMIFNVPMTIWILAILCLAGAALAGWRQGAIRAAFSFVGILFAALLGPLLGKLFGLILPYFGVTSPVTGWIVQPILGFSLVLILFKVAAQNVHKKVETFYRYKAGDLRQTLWERLNTRLGICVGLLNGTAYFVLVSFFLFNFSYLTSQTAVAANQPFVVRMVNDAGSSMVSSGFSRTAAAVGTLPPMYYKIADTTGFLLQNPDAAQRLMTYPGLASLWERDEMLPLMSDPSISNAIVSGASVATVMNLPSIQDFLHNKPLSQSVWTIVETNFNDITNFLATGKSPKFDGEKLIGSWEFNAAVTLAWVRQDRPRMTVAEMRALRSWMVQSYSQTRLLVTGDNQVFVRNLPRIRPGAGGQQSTTELNNWKGEWSNDTKGYTLHVNFNTDEKFLSGALAAEGIRLTLKDGRDTLIFDKVEQ
jgi:hypothetical protein